MDRNELKTRLAEFERLGRDGQVSFRLARLDESTSGLERGQFVLRIIAPWAAGKSFDEIMDPLLDILWQSTDEETRGGISAIQVAPDEETWEVARQLAA